MSITLTTIVTQYGVTSLNKLPKLRKPCMDKIIWYQNNSICFWIKETCIIRTNFLVLKHQNRGVPLRDHP